MIGMGTCGTISGIGKFFKEKNPAIKIVGIDPKGSILKELFEKGTASHAESYKVEGIGEDMKPGNCDFSVVDEIVQITDKESLLMTRALLNKEGIFCGTSSGAAVVGALAWMAKQSSPKKVVVILPDSGNRYLSKVFNDAWMIENSFLEKRSENSVGDLIKVLHKSNKILTANPKQKVEEVVTAMREAGVSQLPVLDGDKIVGVIAETSLLRPLFSKTISPSDPIQSLVDNNYSTVLDSDPLENLNEIFASNKVAFVLESNKIKYVLTKIDLISYLSAQSK
jgi:cystathionine beta-synthase